MAVDGRTHVRVLQIQARGMQLRVQRAYVAGGLGLRRCELLVFLACDGVLSEQALGTGMPGGRIVELRLRALDLGVEALDLDLKRARVDLEQHLSLADSGPLDELYRVDEATDARPHLDGVDGLQLAGELVPVMQGPSNDLGDGDRGRWRRSIRRGLGVRMAAGGEHDRPDNR